MTEHLYFYKVRDFPLIYDGDTVTAEISVGFHMTARIPCRLAFINTPELTGEQREAGLAARDYLRNVLTSAISVGAEVILYSHKRDKYGRWLVTIYVNGVNVNAELVEKGYATVYGN